MARRLGNSVRQRTLLNLGRHFDCPPAVDEEAQRIAAQLVARGAGIPAAGPADVQPVDVDSLRLIRPCSVGVEQVGLWALEQVGPPDLLTRLGVNGALCAAAAGLIVGRLAQPASERATLTKCATACGSCSAWATDANEVSPDGAASADVGSLT